MYSASSLPLQPGHDHFHFPLLCAHVYGFLFLLTFSCLAGLGLECSVLLIPKVSDSLPAEPHRKPNNTVVVAYPFSSGSYQPRKRIGVSCIAGGFFTNWAIREDMYLIGSPYWVLSSKLFSLGELLWSSCIVLLSHLSCQLKYLCFYLS